MLNLDDPRLRLNNLLTRYEALSGEHRSATPQIRSSEAVVGAFDDLARDVIRPAMEQIGAEMDRKGYDYEIVIAPGQQIVMYFYPSLMRRSAYSASCCPYVSFSSDPTTEQIHVVRSTLMPNGRGRAETTVTLSAHQVTRHCVETQILNALENVLDALEG
jgi:hypothetical protein